MIRGALNHRQNDYPMFKPETRTPCRTLLTAGLFYCASAWLLPAFAANPEQAEAEEEGNAEAENGVIIQSPEQKTINEYRINGKLYMIRISPEKGAPYYLVDADGDGDLETRTNELAPDFLIPSWVIFSW
ncbi:hypothetical protein MNBD_GAMMA20-898 [hydrothermal vent metagenome]|uniref:DUF2782 domain-containing protein n=1 Tax=hydrothermal vent metagenome TaxID=652676 RepID=A0A3B0ZXR0_9ZZZZ